MIWGGISYYDTLGIAVVHDNTDSKKYRELLENSLLLSAAETLGGAWNFQQDSASVHRSAYSNQWLQKREIDFLAWQAKSPDLDITENFWGLMARKMWENGRQFTKKMELAQVIAEVCDNMREQYLKTLYEFRLDRLLDVCALHGGNTKYWTLLNWTR